MRMLLKLAWRNVWRNRLRSVIIAAAVAIGLWAALFLMAFYYGMIAQRVETVIQEESSHLQLHAPGFLADLEPRLHLHDADEVAATIRQRPAVRQVAPRVIVQGMLMSAAGSAGVRCSGVEPAAEDSTTHLSGKLVEGSYFDPAKKNGILISMQQAKKLKLKLRSKVVLMAQDTTGEITSGAFRVQGIYRTINTPYDEMNVFITRSAAAELLGVPGACHELAVVLRANDAIATEKASLQQRFPAIEVKDWMETNPEAELMVTSFDSMMLVFTLIIFLGLAFGLLNTMLMAVLERTREIGMLVSIGMGRARLFVMILLETLMVSLVGCPVGLGLALLTIGYAQRHGIDLRAFAEMGSSFGFDLVVHPAITARHVWNILVLVFSTALLSAAYPAAKALTIKAAEAIRK